MDAAASGSIGGTYIGSPVCCAAAFTTIKYMKKINLNQKAKVLGTDIKRRLKNLKKVCPEIGDVRGIGAMIAIEFVKNNDPSQPDADLCSKIVEGCSENGLILLSAGTHKNIIRILSPLVITQQYLDKGMTILENEIKKATKK
ncbi:aminotransferase class III-fold pyridoxal phosphate-dependent enzyme [Thalassobellus suaedae]|uniref:Aminotransferase class III-fold pyridoxal phosphate-dependent enzyme n=1 Tax=Thalassobellus suaedae TaxID=3074124 RepID=A0ABY9XSC6_9FLAO|nr:aminotransferase class III-fold pyridoxal phosphate-dependent enzyme [Flavobacteriaceae bacterium HL-DH14]